MMTPIPVPGNGGNPARISCLSDDCFREIYHDESKLTVRNLGKIQSRRSTLSFPQIPRSICIDLDLEDRGIFACVVLVPISMIS
jgi:hypothetical protein